MCPHRQAARATVAHQAENRCPGGLLPVLLESHRISFVSLTPSPGLFVPHQPQTGSSLGNCVWSSRFVLAVCQRWANKSKKPGCPAGLTDYLREKLRAEGSPVASILSLTDPVPVSGPWRPRCDSRGRASFGGRRQLDLHRDPETFGLQCSPSVPRTPLVHSAQRAWRVGRQLSPFPRKVRVWNRRLQVPPSASAVCPPAPRARRGSGPRRGGTGGGWQLGFSPNAPHRRAPFPSLPRGCPAVVGVKVAHGPQGPATVAFPQSSATHGTP